MVDTPLHLSSERLQAWGRIACATRGGDWRDEIERRLDAGEHLLELLEGIRSGAREAFGEELEENGLDKPEQTESASRALDWLTLVAGGELEGLADGLRGDWLERLSGLLPEVAERLGRRTAAPNWELKAKSERLESVPGYVLHERLGEGGMGTVYRATQAATGREVALKLLHRDLQSGEGYSRFESEVQALARLEHPGIASVVDASTLEGLGSGSRRPWLAIELVRGARPLLEHARIARLSGRARLEMMLAICRGVHHGHSRGVVHRDIKSENVLVGDDGCPRLIDFGIARLVGEGDAQISHTMTGNFVGTLETAAPEQVLEGLARPDERADVYALGLLLYHLMTGVPAFQVRGKSLSRVLEQLRMHSAPRPSRVKRGLPVDLDWVVGCALEKDPERRYPDAGALAAELERLLAGRPVFARGPSLMYRARLLVMRHLVAGVAVTGVLLVSALAAVRLAVIESRRNDQLATQSEESRLETYLTQIMAADQTLQSGDMRQARRVLELTDPDLRRFEWSYLMGQLKFSAVPLAVPKNWYRNISFGGGRALAVNQYQEIQHDLFLFDERWEQVGKASLDLGYNLRFFELDPTGRRVIALARSGLVQIFDWEEEPAGQGLRLIAGEPFELKGITKRASEVIRWVRADFARGRLWLATGDDEIGYWRPEGPPEFVRVSETAGSAVFMDVSPNGATVATLTLSGELQVTEAETGTVLHLESKAPSHSSSWRRGCYFSPCGRWLAVHRLDDRVDILRTSDWTQAATLTEGIGPHQSDAWAENGNTFLVTTNDGGLLEFDVVRGVRLRRVALSPNEIASFGHSGDYRRWIVGDRDGLAYRFDLDELGEALGPDDSTEACWRLSWAPDSKAVSWFGYEGTVSTRSLDSREESWSREFVGPPGDVANSNGHLLWVAEQSKLFGLNRKTGSILAEETLERTGLRILEGLSDREFVLATGPYVQVRDELTLKLLREAELEGTGPESMGITTLACSPDGATIAVGNTAGELRLLNANDLSEKAYRVVANRSPIRGLRFGGSGGWLAVILRNGEPELLSGSDLSLVSTLPDPGSFATGVDFHPTQNRLAVGDQNGHIRLFEVPSGRLLITIKAGIHIVEGLEFSPDGSFLAAGSRSGVTLVHTMSGAATELPQREEPRPIPR